MFDLKFYKSVLFWTFKEWKSTPISPFRITLSHHYFTYTKTRNPTCRCTKLLLSFNDSKWVNTFSFSYSFAPLRPSLCPLHNSKNLQISHTKMFVVFPTFLIYQSTQSLSFSFIYRLNSLQSCFRDSLTLTYPLKLPPKNL